MSPSAVDDVIAAEAKRLAEAKRVADAEGRRSAARWRRRRRRRLPKRADASGSGPGPSSDPEPADLSAARSKLEEMTRKAKANAAEAARGGEGGVRRAALTDNSARRGWRSIRTSPSRGRPSR